MYTLRMSNSLVPDQARRFVGPNLCPNCFQRLPDDKNGRCTEKIKVLAHADILNTKCPFNVQFSSFICTEIK